MRFLNLTRVNGAVVAAAIGALIAGNVGCVAHRELWSVLTMDQPDPVNYSEAGASKIAPFVDRKWPSHTRYERVADDILKTHPVVEPPGKWAWRWAPGAMSDQTYPPEEWAVRFGPDYIELVSARFTWYGSFLFTVFLKFKDGELVESSVHAEECCP